MFKVSINKKLIALIKFNETLVKVLVIENKLKFCKIVNI